MPPNGPRDHRKRPSSSSGKAKIKVKRTRVRTSLADITEVNFNGSEDEDAGGGSVGNGNGARDDVSVARLQHGNGGGVQGATAEEAAARQVAAANAAAQAEGNVNLINGGVAAQANVDSDNDDNDAGAARAVAQANANSINDNGAAQANVNSINGNGAAQANINADNGDNAVNASEDDNAVYVPDTEVGLARAWDIRILQQPPVKALASVRKEWDNALVHESRFDPSLDCRYKVGNPEWKRFKIYQRILKGGDEYRINDFVTIRPTRAHPKGAIKVPNPNEKERILTPKNDWIAHILDFRSTPDNQVFALVNWMYWPDDLYTAWSKNETKAKSGRKGYHGDHELIASNHLDIVDAHSFDMKFNHLIEQDFQDENAAVITEYYYRQSYDYTTGKLTELKRYCKCKKYNKPDQPLVQCTSLACGKWLHQACVIDKVLSREWIKLYKALGLKSSKHSLKSAMPPWDINSVHINDKRYRDHLKGKITQDGNQVKVTQIQTDIVTYVPIKCLVCERKFR